MISNKQKFFDVAVLTFIFTLLVLFAFEDVTITGRVVGEPDIRSLNIDITPKSFTLPLADSDLTLVGKKMVNVEEELIIQPYKRVELSSFYGDISLKKGFYEVEGYVWGISSLDERRELLAPRKVHFRLYEGVLQTNTPTTTTAHISDNRGSYYLEDFKGTFSFSFDPDPVLSLYGHGLVYS